MKNVIAGSLVLMALAACGNNGGVAAPGATSGEANLGAVTTESVVGHYSGALPCPDCKAISTQLDLADDGKYKIDEVFEGRENNNVLNSEGTWTLDARLGRLTLRPTPEGWAERVFKVESASALRPLDGNGNAYSDEGLNDLRKK